MDFGDFNFIDPGPSHAGRDTGPMGAPFAGGLVLTLAQLRALMWTGATLLLIAGGVCAWLGWGSPADAGFLHAHAAWIGLALGVIGLGLLIVERIVTMRATR